MCYLAFCWGPGTVSRITAFWPRFRGFWAVIWHTVGVQVEGAVQNSTPNDKSALFPCQHAVASCQAHGAPTNRDASGLHSAPEHEACKPKLAEISRTPRVKDSRLVLRMDARPLVRFFLSC